MTLMSAHTRTDTAYIELDDDWVGEGMMECEWVPVAATHIEMTHIYDTVVHLLCCCSWFY